MFPHGLYITMTLMYNLKLEEPVYNLFYQFADILHSSFAYCTSEVVPLLFPDFRLAVEFLLVMIRFLLCIIKLCQGKYTIN